MNTEHCQSVAKNLKIAKYQSIYKGPLLSLQGCKTISAPCLLVLNINYRNTLLPTVEHQCNVVTFPHYNGHTLPYKESFH